MGHWRRLGNAGFVVCVFPPPACGPSCSASERTDPNLSILQLHNELQETEGNQKLQHTHQSERDKTQGKDSVSHLGACTA